MPITVLRLNHNKTDFTLPFRTDQGHRRDQINNIAQYLMGAASGAKPCKSLDIIRNNVGATGTLTLTSVSAGAVVSVNGVEFTATNGASTAPNTFDQSVSDNATAANLAAAINASTSPGISGVISATSGTNVVTLTSVGYGAGANAVGLESRGVRASATLTCVSVAAAATFSINGVTFTSEQEMARGTITITGGVAGDTVTINGVTFTCLASGAVAGSTTFNVGGSDTLTAVALAAAINATVGVTAINGVITATSAATVVSLRAVAAGTAANAYALTQTGGHYALSGATLTGGAAVAANKFDYGDTNTQTALEIVRAIGASVSALVAGQVTATNVAGVVTVQSTFPGTQGNATTLVGGTGITASSARLAGGAVVGTQASGTCTITSGAGTETATINGVAIAITWATSDNNSATLLAAAINSSTNALVRGIVTASATTNVVTITSVQPGVQGNGITLAASGTGNVASGARLTGGAADTAIVASGKFLTGGTSDAMVTLTL